MKKGLLVTALILVVINLTAQKIDFDRKTVHFGEVKLGTRNTAQVKIYNHSQKPVLIQKVAWDCSCTKVKWSKAPIMPKDSTLLNITFTPNEIGLFYKTITITTSPDSEKPETVTIRGKVK